MESGAGWMGFGFLGDGGLYFVIILLKMMIGDDLDVM